MKSPGKWLRCLQVGFWAPPGEGSEWEFARVSIAEQVELLRKAVAAIPDISVSECFPPPPSPHPCLGLCGVPALLLPHPQQTELPTLHP